MTEVDAYIWLTLCCCIILAELYFPYKQELFSSFLIASAVNLIIALFTFNFVVQVALFIILSFFVRVAIRLHFKLKAKGKRRPLQKAIALCDIKQNCLGPIYRDGRITQIENSSAEIIERGEVVAIIKD